MLRHFLVSPPIVTFGLLFSILDLTVAGGFGPIMVHSPGVHVSLPFVVLFGLVSRSFYGYRGYVHSIYGYQIILLFFFMT